MTNRSARRRAEKAGLVLVENGVTPAPPRPKATLAAFLYADVKPDTHDCILRDLRAWPEMQYMRMSADALIDRARSRAASEFLQAPANEVGDVLVMVDHDMIWRAGDLEHLVAACLKTGGIVAGIYSKRQFGDGIAIRFSNTVVGSFVQGEDKLIPCEYVSTGFLAIHRHVLAKLAETLPLTLGNFWPFFLPSIVEREWSGMPQTFEEASEDWAFCLRAREAGFSIDADLYPVLVHIGDYGYRVLDGQFTPPPHLPVHFNVSAAPSSRAIGTLMRDVADYSEVSPDRVNAITSQARVNLVEMWARFGGFEGEAEWYARPDVGRCYIMDLSEWHVSSCVGTMEGSLVDVEDKHVLDFGAGIGTWALLAAERGAHVAYVEPNDQMADFIKYRAERLELECPTRIASLDDAQPRRYDMIVAWHVLEHLADPETAARQLAALLAPNGIICAESDFHLDSAHPMHHTNYTRRGAELWEAAGLVPADLPLTGEGSVQWWKRPGEAAWRESVEVATDGDHPTADEGADGAQSRDAAHARSAGRQPHSD